MRLRYTRPALHDLDALLDYIAGHNRDSADRVRARIKSVADLLLRYPLIGAETEEPGIRRVVTTPYPYLIFYEVSIRT